jgi:hypothetical protein
MNSSLSAIKKRYKSSKRIAARAVSPTASSQRYIAKV